MFPLSDDARAPRFAFLTWLLIIANAYVFLREITVTDPTAFIMHFALVPANVHFNDYVTLIPFVTAIFLHGGFLHILSNMWFLFIFGDNVEGELSPAGYLFLFVLAGTIGNLVQYLLAPGTTVPILGASGAIAGILGCYYVLFPQARIRTLVFLFFFVTIVDISAPLMLGYWFLLQIFSGFGTFSQISAEQGGVAFFAHVAGFIVGIVVGRFVKRMKQNTLYHHE